jgi:Tetratricopeptide repeat/Cytochrome c554 and c-prime
MLKRYSAIVLISIIATYLSGATLTDVVTGQNQVNYVGNRACAACHSSIYESYSRHPMALTSGVINQTGVEGSFRHAPSSINYRIYQKGTKTFFSYERPGDRTTNGKQELDYFVGSGMRGRSYLFSVDGFLYQAPISYYAQKKRWDISPGYESYREMPTRPIEPSCLYCHTSQVQPISGTQNRYSSPPFAHAAVSCERCHGPGGDHVKGRGAMVNPATLAADRRDSVCAQCHLIGEARIQRPGRSLDMFRPGDLLSDYVSHFVYEDNHKKGLKALSHVEAIAQSVCKRHSEGELSCFSCHDPHSVPDTQQKPAYFRGKCLACHQQRPTTEQSRHYSKNFDCASCHMPKISSDVSHTAVTDHRILRKPLELSTQAKPGSKLTQFGGNENDPRGLGIAYAERALETGDAFSRSEALRLLTKVLPLYPHDAEVLTHLGYIHHVRGELDESAVLYSEALRADPQRLVAAIDLGAIYAQRGQLDRAMSLWRAALERNPGSSEAGINLAISLCSRGDRTPARESLRRVLRFNPDQGLAKQLLRDLDSAQPRCRTSP